MSSGAHSRGWLRPGYAKTPPAYPTKGVSSTLRPFDSIIDVSEYWIARWSLSSGAHSRDPLASNDV